MAEATTPFVWGESGQRLTPDQVKRQRKVAEAMIAKGSDYSPVQHWTQGLARVSNSIVGALQQRDLDAKESAGIAEQSDRNRSMMGVTPDTAAVKDGADAREPSVAGNLGDPNEIESTFVDTVKGAGLTNPFGLGAVAAYGKAESGFDPANVNRSWSDPSESGQPGTSGGIMSWRDDRLANLNTFAQKRGERAPSVQTQALFLAQEDPQLIPRLQAAKTAEEANGIMANAWRFAGYDRPGGENERRLGLTRQYSQRFGTPQTAVADMPAPGASPAEMPGRPGFNIPSGGQTGAIPILPEGIEGAALATQPGGGPGARSTSIPAPFVEQGAPQGGPAMSPQFVEQGSPAVPASPQGQPPSFMAEGVSQPWMGTAATPPEPAATAAQARAPMPPARPADLPAPGAVEAIGQMPPQQPAPASMGNMDHFGDRLLQVQSEEARRGQPAAPQDGGSPFSRIVQALTGQPRQAAATATPSDRVAQSLGGSPARPVPANPNVAKVAQAYSPAAAAAPAAFGGQQSPRLTAAFATLNSPYAQPGEKAIAQSILQQSFKSAEFDTVTRPDGSVWRARKDGVGQPVQVFGPQSKPEGPTGDMREYDLHVAQEKAAGRKPDSFTDWTRGNKASGRTAINIDTRGAGKFAEKANEHQAKRYSDMRTAADEGVALRGDIEALSSLLEGVNTGRGAEAKLGIAQMAKGLGLDSVADWLTSGKINEMEAAQSVMDRLTPRMRVPGSGATSDMEMRTFRNSIPSLGKQPGGNRIIGDTFRSMLDHQAMAGDIAGQALRGEIDQAQADKLLKELPSPFARFKEYQKAQEDAAKAPKSGAATAPPPSASAPAAAATTPEARKSLGGKTYVKRGADWFEE